MVLGTPIGSAPFVAEKLQSMVNDERRLWEAILDIPDLQCAWQVLLQSANPRANHTLSTLPPALSLEYGRLHDEGIWGTALALIGQLPGRSQRIGVKGPTPCCLHAQWPRQETRSPHRAHRGAHLPRSRSNCPDECILEGLERECVCGGFQTN